MACFEFVRVVSLPSARQLPKSIADSQASQAKSRQLQKEEREKRKKERLLSRG
jgi:hypothetical protein